MAVTLEYDAEPIGMEETDEEDDASEASDEVDDSKEVDPDTPRGQIAGANGKCPDR